MKIATLHTWEHEPRAAIALQRKLAAQVNCRPLLAPADVALVAGADVSIRDGMAHAAVSLLEMARLRPVETATACLPLRFPYIPGLLSFREGPALIAAFRRLRRRPDLVLVDGMGIMHPRRPGLASHIGLWLDLPTIGCGKSRLLGEYREPEREKGARSPLTHRGEQLGAVLRSRRAVRPLFISPGHLINLESALRITLACCPRWRLPEPIRAAHRAAACGPPVATDSADAGALS